MSITQLTQTRFKKHVIHLVTFEQHIVDTDTSVCVPLRANIDSQRRVALETK